ncbi:MAG: hypothetical protein K9M15_01290 [Candidatus Marinimicrobia bacterium]|nr:hypothetical protein [Candidatus Neomarinimicrobiota bacterium]
MQKKHSFISTTMILIIVGVLVVGGGVWYLTKLIELKSVHRDVEPVCTADAKICPDGSSVGRVGPDCEFEKCPEEVADLTTNWKTYRNEEFGFEIGILPTWESYNVSVSKCCHNISSNELNNFTDIIFSPKAVDRFGIFEIMIFTKEQWNRWQRDSHKIELYVLGQNDLYVMAIDNMQTEDALIDCTGGGQYNKFEQARCKEIPQIIKTFEII